MECTVSWTGNAGTRSGMGFLAETGSGHTLVMDGAPDPAKPENGGQNPAPTERGRPYQVYRGVYFHPEQWDGSDLFFVNGHRVVRDTVVKAFKRAKISNVQLTPLPDEEIDVFAYHLSRPRSE